MGVVVDTYTQQVIHNYLKDLQHLRKVKTSKVAVYGWGTYTVAATQVIDWAQTENYCLYKGNDILLSTMAQRLHTYVGNLRVCSQSYDDARWIATMIRIHHSYKQVLTVPEPITYTEPEPEPVATYNGELDDVIKVAHALREFSVTHDAELWGIVTGAEVSVLRLLVDRLES